MGYLWELDKEAGGDVGPAARYEGITNRLGQPIRPEPKPPCPHCGQVRGVCVDHGQCAGCCPDHPAAPEVLEQEYRTAEARYDAAREACEASACPEASRDQKAYWARSLKRIVKGNSGTGENRERATLAEEAAYHLARQGGRALVDARDEAAVAMNAAYDRWQALLAD